MLLGSRVIVHTSLGTPWLDDLQGSKEPWLATGGFCPQMHTDAAKTYQPSTSVSAARIVAGCF